VQYSKVSSNESLSMCSSTIFHSACLRSTSKKKKKKKAGEKEIAGNLSVISTSI